MAFIVAQLGARRHYAIPRMLENAGMLQRFYTDICGVKGWTHSLSLLPTKVMPKAVRRLTARKPQGVPLEKITAFTRFGLEYARRRMKSVTPGSTTATHLWAGQTFCSLVIKGIPDDMGGVYTFNSAGLELLEYARARGLPTVMEQTIAPRAIQHRLLAEEHDRFPNWEIKPENDHNFDEFVNRELAEWQAADLILCGSSFVKNGIKECGGPDERCVIVPYGVDHRFSLPEKEGQSNPLRILTVGALGLRKGVPYIVEAAKQLGKCAKFRLVGPISVQESIARKLQNHIELTGPVPRSEILKHYAWADVFLLPSICEGSATVIYEALAAGLPVICTTNTGSVVRDEIDGFIVPLRDVNAIEEKLKILIEKPKLLKQMSINARLRAEDFTLEAYKKRLIEVLQHLI